jgi:hypothetical protein
MANYAVIKNGIVNNVIVADTQAIAEQVTGFTCVEVEHVPGAPGIGWTYDGAEFTAPVVEETE